MLRARRFLWLLLAIGASSAADRSGSDLKPLYESRDWFKLRSVVEAPNTPAFYKGAVACAFHDMRRAEKYFQSAIQSGTDKKQLFDVHGQLAYMYMRTGQHQKTYEHLSAMQRLNPDYSGLKGALVLFSALNGRPELSVARRRFSRLNMSDGSFIPVSVNGRSAAYGFDTGMNLSVMSEAEAGRLGLRVHDASSSELRDGASGNEALPAQNNVDRDWYHIWLGMDVLGSARAVTIDFKSMTVAIEQHR